MRFPEIVLNNEIDIKAAADRHDEATKMSAEPEDDTESTADVRLLEMDDEFLPAAPGRLSTFASLH
jgi:hypothetical protein